MTSTPPTADLPPAQPERVFADHVAAYALAGWPCVLPVPPATKTPPPSGFTGAEGRDTDPHQLVAWAKTHATSSIALRMPDGVIGIDADQYEKDGKQKHGAETIAAREVEWGPLPATWSSTARGDGPSRIRFYRVPAQRYATRLSAEHDGVLTGDVEVIQRHHRYAVVWPSHHESAGGPYLWYDPAGAVAAAPPSPADLAELPAAWVAGLAEGAAAAGPASADHATGASLLEQICEDWSPECAELTSIRLYSVDQVERAGEKGEGSRHDVMTERVHQVVMLAAAGHAGGAYAVSELRATWQRVMAGEPVERIGPEFERMLLTSARKAVTAYGANRIPRDPCLMIQGFPSSTAYGQQPEGQQEAGDPDQESALQIVDPPRWGGVREAIGAHSFDPNAGLDQPLAEKVLERVYPALRYAYDANSWLLRAPDRWEVHGRLSAWAVATVAPLMPVGDATADKGTEQHDRSQRRSRLMSTAGARAVAGKIDDLVAGGMHPASVALGGLDADPEILWAGSMPYALRASVEGPAFAGIDPATPHIRTAGVAPDHRGLEAPTPLWDSFLEAVWPEAAVRAWAVRVLSIAVTGYADRALPILLGETGRGKTQVIHLMMSVLGTYAHAANPKLLGSASNEHDTIIYDLKGRRLSFIDEGPSERKAGQERLKQLTGGGDLTGRQMNQDPVTFPTTHTLVLTTNDEPVLTDPAVRSRARLIPCTGDPDQVRATRAAIGPVAGPAWRAEAPGVLAKLMAEAAAWLADPASGLVTAAPNSIAFLAEHMGAEQDPVAAWVRDETEPWPAGTGSRELYKAFHASCKDAGMRLDQIPSETKWGRALNALGYPSVHTHVGKRRPLRVRPQGFWTPTDSVPPGVTGVTPSTSHAVGPAAAPRPATAQDSHQRDGYASPGDGTVTGDGGSPSREFLQVNPSGSVGIDGSDGSIYPLTHTHAHTPAQESLTQISPQPVTDPPVVPSANEPAKPKRQRSAEATAKAAQAKAEKRAAAITEAGGPIVGLPAVVTRDGAVRHADVDLADRLLETITDANGPTGGSAAVLTVDVEHTGYPIGHEHYALRTVQLGNDALCVVLDPTDPAQAAVIRLHLNAAGTLHAHSATADLIPLADAGLLLDLEGAWSRMHDTVIPAKLADPALTGSDPGLKKISLAMLGAQALSPSADEARKALFKAGGWLVNTEPTTPLERSGWAQVDPGCEVMIRYAASDVLDDAAIAVRLTAEHDIPDAVLERERAAQRLTARVAARGLRIDGEHVAELMATHTAGRDAAAARVRDLTADLAESKVDNPGSTAQVGAALTALGAHLPRTATGRVSAAEAALLPLRDLEGPVGQLATAVLEHRQHAQRIGLFLEPYHQLVVNGDGRARPTIYTLQADTGRMSSVRPNLQQVPREGGFRACITADPGHVLVSADFAGVELRVAGALSQDRNLLAVLADPERDLHGEVARIAFGPEATKAHRYMSKRGVFGRIYGGGVGAIARGVGVSEAVAQQIIDALDTMLPELSAWSRRVSEAVRAGHVAYPTYAGRVVHLAKDEPHKAPNYLIQGTARELLIDALLRWEQTEWGDCTILPVHDELVVMVPEADAQRATAALVECMTTELYGVAIKAEASEPSFEWKDSA